MPWKGVTVSKQRQRFLEDFQLNYYPITELSERYSISRKTAHKWINRFNQHGQEGYQELSRHPLTCPWRTDQAITKELVKPCPCVIVSRDSFAKLLLIIIVPLTDWNEAYERADWHVPVEPSPENDLSEKSSADTFQVRSISQERLTAKLGALSEPVLEKIGAGLALSLAID